MVVGGTCTDDDEETTPLKKGGVTTTTNIKNKPTNPAMYETTEKQLFANMHPVSASETLIAGLLEGKVDPSQVKRMIAFGTILKPESNLVA